jgi:hypothetical protein
MMMASATKSIYLRFTFLYLAIYLAAGCAHAFSSRPPVNVPCRSTTRLRGGGPVLVAQVVDEDPADAVGRSALGGE